MKEEKYVLIYFYHDTYFSEYETLEQLKGILENLKEAYKNDSDFSYRVYKGEILNI